MNVKYQIFVSSTFRDLEEERRVVIEQILNLGHIPVGMELFQAGDDTQWHYIKERILECDYYIVIVAERYGSQGPDGKSYTQMEYEFAIANDVPVAAFLLHDDARKAWPKEHFEYQKIDEINKFRALCETRICQHWKNADQLGAKVLSGLNEMFRRKPRIGWVRANSVASADALNELAKLSKEKRDLHAELEQYKNSVLPNRKLSVVENKLRIAKLNDYISAFSETDGQLKIDEKLTLLDIFLSLCRNLSQGLSHMQFISAINFKLRLFPSNNVGRIIFDGLIKELTICQLIETDGPRYILTGFGKEFVLELEDKTLSD
jgi:hypothetical protein